MKDHEMLGMSAEEWERERAMAEFMSEPNPFDTHDWQPKGSLEPRCRACGCRLIVPYGDITKAAGEPCPGPSTTNGDREAGA